MSNAMQQHMYYPHNQNTGSAPDPQRFQQMNGSVQPPPVSPPNPYQPSAYGHQNMYNPQPPNQGMMAPRPNYQATKSPATMPPTYPPSATHPQQFTQMAGRPDSRTQPMNNLSQQMSNISLSNPQAPQSANGPHPAQPLQPPPVNQNTMAGMHYSGPTPSQSLPSAPPTMGQSNSNAQNWSQPGPISPNWQSSGVHNMPSAVPQQHQANAYTPGQSVAPKMTDQIGPQGMSQAMPQAMPGRYPGAPSMPQQMPQQMAQPMAQPMPPQPSQPGFGQTAYGQQNQQRLDLEAMPSVVQVIEEDKAKYENNNNVLFTTSIPCSVPPLVTTFGEYEHCIANDGGCARPHHIRSTIYQVPINEDTLKITNIPLAIVVQPFDDSEVEGKNVVPITPSEILRCNRCKAYMNPYMRFIDGGRRFQCSLCHHVTEVSPSYFANLDHTGQRLDKFSRPELYLGSYEFRATDEYCRNGILNARRPHIIFGVELTTTSKPIVEHLSRHLGDIIRNYLPRDPLNTESAPPLIGFVTYNSKIQIYDILNNGHAHIICDVSSTFPPLTTFLVDPLLHMEQIESFLQSLPSLYLDEELETQTVLGPVIEAALLTAQVDSGNWFGQQNPNNSQSIPVGKIYLFHCTLPNFGTDADTPGRLKPRWTTSPEEIRKLLGTDKEKTILGPDANKYYVNLGQKCVTDLASGVELFLFPPMNGSYLDVATLSELVRLSGTGTIYKYFNDFSERFLIDLKFSLRSTFAFDAIMKVRTSTGIRAHDYVGNYYSRTTSDVECAAINSGCNLAVELKYDDKLPEDELVVVQVAILYTAISGERRVRVHNMALSTCQQVADIYRNACCDTSINVLIRQAVSSQRAGDKTVQQTRELLISRAISILTAYRRHCAQPGSSLGQLILPEALKLLPMYICGALKCDAIDGGPEMTPDDKAFAQIKMIGSWLSLSQVTLYPRLLKIEPDESTGQLKSVQIRCSSHKLLASTAFAYLLENGFYILLYIPNAVINGHNQFLSAIFGPQVDSISKIQPELGLPKLATNESQFLNQMIESIEKLRRKSMRIFVIRQGVDRLESIFKSFLYEDKKAVNNAVGGDSGKLEGPSYVDLLVHLHKEIRLQLN